MKIQNILWLTFLCLITFESFSQVKKNSAGFVYPPKDFTGIIDENVVRKYSSANIDWAKVKFNNTGTWKVYSDRDNNEVLTGDGSIFVNFNQKMSVKGFDDSRLLVQWRDDNGNTQIGSIDHRNVFMWRSSICGKNGFPKKAIVISNFSSKRSNNKTVWDFYSHPGCKAHNKMGMANNLEIFFILKSTQDAILLSKSSKDGSLMKGWMPINHLRNWDTRVAYDYRIGNDANEAYKDKSIPIFQTEQELEEFMADPNSLDQIGPMSKGKCLSQIPDTLEFYFDRPLLLNVTKFDQEEDANRRELIAIVNKNSQAHRNVAAVRKEILNLQKRSRNVNILFVIDATRSMQANIIAVKESIRMFSEFLKKQNITGDEMEYKVALTIYRDDEDGILMFKNYNLKPINDIREGGVKIWDIIEKVECLSSIEDLTHEEQVYRGLKEGISNCNFVNDERNIVILIGDAGNDDAESEITREEIDELLKEKDKNYDFFIFQSSNRLSPAFESFSDDAMHWMSLINEDKDNKFKFSQDDGFLTIVNVVPDDDALYVSRGTFITQVERSGFSVNSEVLIEQLTEYLEDSQLKVHKQIQKLESNGGEHLTDDVIRKIAKAAKITFDEAIALIKNNVDMSIESYANMVYYDQVNEANPVTCYQPYIFLTSGELEKMKTKFKKLGHNPNNIDSKKRLEIFIIEELMSFHGLDPNNFDNQSPQYKKIQESTVQTAWMEIFNVDFVYEKIGKTRIDKLSSLKGAQDEITHFYRAVRQFKFSKKQLDKYTWTISQSSKRNSEKFYWIPANKFPGMSKD